MGIYIYVCVHGHIYMCPRDVPTYHSKSPADLAVDYGRRVVEDEDLEDPGDKGEDDLDRVEAELEVRHHVRV